MQQPSFDVPAAMRALYHQLEAFGYKPRIESAPAEWDKGNQYVRCTHVAGWLEVYYRPYGKKVEENQHHWRLHKVRYSLAGFTFALSEIATACQSIP